jgi:hypothetical protein
MRLVNPSQLQLDSISDAIFDCQADVEGFLNRPLIPEERVLEGIYPMPGYDPDSWRAWPDGHQFDDDYAVKTRVQADDESWTVTFYVGLNGPGTAPIVRYVTAHTMRTLREDESYGFPKHPDVTSISAEGQSLQMVARPSEDGAVGSLPKLKTLDRYRRRAVYVRPSRPGPLWPNYGTTWVRGY